MTDSVQKPARILVVDDHSIVRYGMRALLSGADDLQLAGEAESVEEALTAARTISPDAAVIDIVLHDRSGLDLIRQLRAEGHTFPVLVLSMYNESTHAEKALRAGAQGYLMKEHAGDLLAGALRTILSGKLYISDATSEQMLRNYVDESAEPAGCGIDSLTSREKEIFECMGRGMTTRKIAELYELSPRTVEVHRARIKKKLECEDTAQLLRAAVQWVETNSL